MKQASRILTLQTRGPGMYDFTRDIRVFGRETGALEGVLTLMCRHPSASLTIQENADPDVQRDLQGFFDRIVPEGMDWLRHTSEGPDDMPAHIKAAMMPVSLSIPVTDGRLALGTWLTSQKNASHLCSTQMRYAWYALLLSDCETVQSKQCAIALVP